MLNKISVLSMLQLSFITLETASNLLQPEYSIKMLNTENTVLSLGDIDNDDDLEIIKPSSDEIQTFEQKLAQFHKYINFTETTERSNEKFYLGVYGMKNSKPLIEISHPYSPYALATDEKHLSELEKRNEVRRNTRGRRKKKNKSFRGDFRKEMRPKLKIVPLAPPDIEEQELEYNYMEKEYFDYVAKNLNNNVAFKYSDEGKPEENLKDVLYKIVDVKTPKNCTNYTGIGVQAVECLIKNYKNGELNRARFFYSISIVLLVWFCVYLLVAVPLWCSKGWCCCCCRCKFCFPHKTVVDIQKYIALNPPGIYTDSKGEKQQYVPTHQETELYEKLRRLIADF